MFKYRFLCLILCVSLIFSLSGCGNKNDDAYLYFELPSLPTAIDPQTAESTSDLLIVRNIFEGLMRKDREGNTVVGAAESYEKKGLTYTFTLRKDIKWSNGDKVTSDDFVFGLRRALDPKTKAPFASRFFSIKNAKSINSGNLSVDNLGVTALDERTVKINLEYEDTAFLENLATSVAMPCNQKFFKNSGGKYGLNKENIICNGSYRLTKWNQESFGIRLYKNEEYNGEHKARNAAVFLTCNGDIPVTQKLTEGDIDIAFVDSNHIEALKDNGLKTKSFQNICWFLTFNNDFSKEMRTSLLKLTGSTDFGKYNDGYTKADSIYPAISKIDAENIGMTDYDLEGGKTLFINEVKKLEDSKFPSNVTLNYYDNGYVNSYITDIVGHWQNHLSAFVNISAVDNAENLLPQLKNQTLQMAVFPVNFSSKNYTEYLENFNITDFSKSPAELQNQILSSKNIMPLFFQDTTLCFSGEILEIYPTEDNGFLDFAFIVKENG